MFNEDHFTSELAKILAQATGPRAEIGIGDDAAVYEATPSCKQLLCTDQLIEGCHYLAETQAEMIGEKLLKRNLSDLAAMGARPRFAVINCAVRKDHSSEDLLATHRGLINCADKYDCALIGGDLAVTKGPEVYSLALYGEAEEVLLRSTARSGDAIFVTGELGLSFVSQHHLTFTPRLKEGLWLRESGLIHAMMDITDGLLSDLPRMLRASGKQLGAKLNCSSLPARTFGHSTAHLRLMLTEGEDYELVFTLPADKAAQLERDWPFAKTQLSRIGEIHDEGFSLQDESDNDLVAQFGKGFDHFSQ